jgi:starch synthase
MKDKKILYISSEVVPYLPHSELSNLAFEIPKMVNDRGGQTRIFIPKYGLINERRHQLHEVIRLSGMNLVINDIDMPLIIKVASIPKERMQVYFIDNDDYFRGRGLYTDEQQKLYDDNEERAIFFAKGVIETVKKLNWSPDIIHVQGWISSLVPLYCKQYYKDEPLLAETKIVTSFFAPPFEGKLAGDLFSKIGFDGIEGEHMTELKNPTLDNMFCNAAQHADGIILASTDVTNKVKEFAKATNKPLLDLSGEADVLTAHEKFYTSEF